MPPSWWLRPDGSYKQLTSAEDVVSDANLTLEDAAEAVEDFAEVRREVVAAMMEARRLVEVSRRERRLRLTRLRVLKVPG